MDPRLIVKVADAPGRTAGESLRVVTLADGSTYTYSYGADTPPARIEQVQGTRFDPANFGGLRLIVTGRDEDVATAYAKEVKEPTARQTAPPAVHAGPAGVLVYTGTEKPGTLGGYEPIPGTQPAAPREPISSSGGTFWRYNPLTGEMEMVGANPLELAERQATATRQAAQDLAAAGRQVETDRLAAARFQLDVIQQAERAGEIDAKRAAELRDYLYKTEVELPQKLREQEDVRLAAGIERGRHAGEAAVSDITAQLPYRYSPGFTARQQAVGAEAARGNFTPGIYQSIARAYRGPDLQGARQAAESRYQGEYLNQFGFDPLETAGQLGYRQPGPGAAPLAGLGDDEDEIKRVAAVLAGR